VSRFFGSIFCAKIIRVICNRLCGLKQGISSVLFGVNKYQCRRHPLQGNHRAVPVLIRRFPFVMRCIKRWSATVRARNLRFGRCALYKQSHTLRQTYPPHSPCQGRMGFCLFSHSCRLIKPDRRKPAQILIVSQKDLRESNIKKEVRIPSLQHGLISMVVLPQPGQQLIGWIFFYKHSALPGHFTFCFC
jgi:hypothetical protein